MSAIPQATALDLWLAMLAGNEPAGGLLELRLKPRGRPLRRFGFFDAHDRGALVAAIERAREQADVYVGVAPRREVYRANNRRQSGGVDAIERVWAIFVDADTPEACVALAIFKPAAAVVVRSGTGIHAYWPLRRPLAPAHAKRANRRLAHHLGADVNATDAARILRPPGTLNHKSEPPRAVECIRLETVSYEAADVVGELPDPQPPRSSAASRLAAPPAVTNASAALSGLARIVRDAQPGNRNAALNWAAHAAGKRVSTGELAEQDVRAELRAAAEAAGLDEHEINGTLTSGLSAGRAA